MAREKANYRDMVSILREEELPLLMTRGQACKALGCSRDYLAELIIKGEIDLKDNKVTLGSIARYIC